MKQRKFITKWKRQGKNILTLVLALGMIFPSGAMAETAVKDTWKASAIETMQPEMELPETPEQPEAPETGLPETPEQPEGPETGLPEAPEQPEGPETGLPETPEQPEGPETGLPETPEQPEAPGVIQPEEDALAALLKENLRVAELAAPKMVLYSDAEGENPIVNGQQIELDDALYVAIEWESLEGAAERVGEEIHLGELPAVFSTPHDEGSLPVEAQLPPEITAENKIFATLRWEANKSDLWVTFNNMGTYEGKPILSLLEDAKIIYQCALENDNSHANDKGEVIIDLPGGDSTTIKVKEWLPKGPELAKSVGAIDGNGAATWTITYTQPTASYDGDKPNTLVDTLPTGLTYVARSFAEITSKVTVDDSVEGVLTFDVSAVDPGAKVEITYQTMLSEEALEKIWHGGSPKFEYKNEAEALKDGNSLTNKLTAIATLTVDNNWPGFHMMKKDGAVKRPVAPGDPWTIDWIVTVNTAKQSFKSLQMVDTMGKGLLLDQSTVKVNGSLVSPMITTTGDGKTEMTVQLVTDGRADASYSITYTTEIDSNYFNQNGADALADEDLNNVAKLVYVWLSSGDGPAAGLPPAITKTPKDLGISGSLIKKDTVASYDAVNHSLQWKVTLNPNEVNVTRAVIEDDLADKGQTFLGEGKDRVATEASLKAAFEEGLRNAGLSTSLLQTFTLSDDGKKLSATLGEIGKETVSVFLHTYVDDSKVWAGNVKDKEYKNTVDLLATETTVDGTAITGDMHSTANHYVTSNVLKKEHVSFDINTKDLVWKLTVNQNKTQLGDVTITDVLPKGLTCDGTRALLDGVAFAGDNSVTVSNEGDGTQKITVTLKSVTDTMVITFPTKVDVNTEAFQMNQTVSFKNVANMTSGANDKTVTSNESEAKVKNNVLTKAVAEKADGVFNKVRYTVEINPSGMELLKEGDTLKVMDSLPDGAYLDVASVKLLAANTATALKDGIYQTTMTQGAAIVPMPPVDYNTTDNVFEINLPVTKESYILSYDVYIVRANVELANKVKLKGSVIQDTSDNQTAERKFTLKASGSARMRLPAESFFTLELKKVDERNNKLSGAVFGLYSAKNEDSLLAKATCDEGTGICVLALPKSEVAGLTTLYWREIQAPVGYLTDSRWQEITVADHNPDDVITVTNKLIPDTPNASLTIKKVDEEDKTKVLSGARFALYKDKECTTLAVAGTQTTDENGQCTFTGLMPHTVYYAKETLAPSGYLLQEAAIEVISGEQGATAENEMTNRRTDWNLRASVIVEKTNKNGDMLAGAEFALFQADKTTLVSTRETDAEGLAIFYGLAEGTYFAKETRAPGGYVLSNQWFEVLVQENGSSRISVVNERKAGAPSVESGNSSPTPSQEEKTKEDGMGEEKPNDEVVLEDGMVPADMWPATDMGDSPQEKARNQTENGFGNGKNSNVPPTGDRAEIALWAGLMAVSLLALGLLKRKTAKRNK